MNQVDSWREEQRSVYLYRVLADVERGSTRAALFKEMAWEAEKQAAIWAENAKAEGHPITEIYRPDIRTRLLSLLLRRYGPRALRKLLAAVKVRGMSLYTLPGSGSHTIPMHVNDVGRRHRNSGGGNLRAAVFGINDGLVSNASLIMGVAGASADSKTILLAGIAGLSAGAFSMAAGEYISVRSQREFYEYQIDLERKELETYPEAEAAELALIYQAKGIGKEEAKRVADALIADPEKALDTLAREELGLNPDELGSPWAAALASFFSFVAGASVPLLPFIFARGPAALQAAVVLSLVCLFGVGAALSLFTGRHAIKSGLRMSLIGAAVGMITFAIGRLAGISV
ncbi:MAG: VIT1/CCC1 transporter family protein [Burkholderiales bacterium]|nr:VIT1/CCC1 transporter family protein [Burkholderiales bacterium]